MFALFNPLRPESNVLSFKIIYSYIFVFVLLFGRVVTGCSERFKFCPSLCLLFSLKTLLFFKHFFFTKKEEKNHNIVLPRISMTYSG